MCILTVLVLFETPTWSQLKDQNYNVISIRVTKVTPFDLFPEYLVGGTYVKPPLKDTDMLIKFL